MNTATTNIVQSSGNKPELVADIEQINNILAPLTAEQRVAWVVENQPQTIILSSSFGIQAAVMLHMVTQVQPDIPVILTDTGYLFDETYTFIDELTKRLNLNLKVYRSELTPAWQEARFGQLWTKGEAGLKQYNQMNKVEPMNRALEGLDV
ncbi:UNVERIFIED_CONTAM: hypothetical protein GTU68_008834, partial [Idotea baltica]|nr:hypothetical protein [Idotea baltica]